MLKSVRLLEEAATSAKAARAIAEKAQREGRDLTAGEHAEYQRLATSSIEGKARAESARQSEDVMAQAKAIADTVGWGEGMGDPDGLPAGFGGSSSFHTGAGRPNDGRSWSQKTAAHLGRVAKGHGIKALTSGSIDVPSVVEPDVIRLGVEPTRVLDLISSRGITANTFSYLRQTVRTNNAAPVADGATKPTSVFTTAEVEGRARVIAHLSEPVPERYFADAPELERFLTVEMEDGISAKVEQQVVSGSGSGENLTGLLNTSGIVSVAYATDVFTTTRKALTALAAQQERPTAWVFHPADTETLDLVREDGTSGGYLLGNPAGNAVQSLWGLPRVSSFAVPVGTAVLGDWRQIMLYVREAATLSADRSGAELFDKNLVKLRVEGRFGLAVLRPSAFAVVDLTA